MKHEWAAWAPQDVIDEWEFEQIFKEDQDELKENFASLFDELEESVSPISKGRIETAHKAREAFDEYMDFSATHPDHDIIYKMLTHWRMEEVWTRFKELDGSSLDFTKVIASAYMKAIQVGNKPTAKQASKNLDEIKRSQKNWLHY